MLSSPPSGRYESERALLLAPLADRDDDDDELLFRPAMGLVPGWWWRFRTAEGLSENTIAGGDGGGARVAASGRTTADILGPPTHAVPDKCLFSDTVSPLRRTGIGSSGGI